MLVRTKTRHTKRSVKTNKGYEGKRIPWREVFKSEIEKYSEAGLMLRGSRHKKQVTQKQLADALGVSQNHISEMENGKRPIGKVMALRFAKFFETDYRKFL